MKFSILCILAKIPRLSPYLLCFSCDLIVFFPQENLIHDDNKLILLASLSDSLEYVADSVERCVFYVLCNLAMFYCML